VAFLFARGRRRLAERNLARAFPDLPAEARRQLCRECFQHLGLMVIELAAMAARPLEATLATLSVEGSDHLEAAMKTHGRALALTGHLGNWEFLPASCRLTPHALTIVARPLDSPTLEALSVRLREKAGGGIVDKRNAVRPVLRALTAGRLVGILLDQNAARHESVFVPFFGHEASTSKSIAVWIRRFSSPLGLTNNNASRIKLSQGSISRRFSCCTAAAGHNASFRRIDSPFASRTHASAHNWSRCFLIHSMSNR